MCVDCVLTSPRITQVDPGDEPPSRGGSVTSTWKSTFGGIRVLREVAFAKSSAKVFLFRLMYCTVNPLK
jgi:hypothetical protein